MRTWYRVVLVFESGLSENIKVEAYSRTEAGRKVLQALPPTSTGLVSLTTAYSGPDPKSKGEHGE